MPLGNGEAFFVFIKSELYNKIEFLHNSFSYY